MSFRHGWLFAAAALAGCTSPESIQHRPVDWRAEYAVPWETMANCIQAAFSGSMVSPRYNQRDRTAALTISSPGIIAPGPVIAEYRISQTTEDRSAVEQKSWAGSTFPGRPIADRCARGA